MIKIIHRYFRSRWERYYLKNYWHIILDLSLIIVIIALLAGIFAFYFYPPTFSGLRLIPRAPLDINNPPLELDFSVASTSLKIKEPSILKIKFKNSANANLENISLDFSTLDKNFGLNRLEASSSLLKVNGRNLNIAKVGAQSEGEILVKVYFTNKGEGRTINWQAQSQYAISGQSIKDSFQLPALKLSAELEVKDAAYYTSPQGDQLGIGPLPPLVGIPTSYWVFWEVRGNGEFQDVILSARLPKGVELSGDRSLLAGDFSYNSSTRQIIWKIPKLEANSDSYRLSFEVELVPTESQVGQVLNLLNSGQYYAKDVLTGEEISGRLGSLNTNLSHDRFNSGQGEVTRP